MGRFILRYKGQGNCPVADVQAFRAAGHVKILDDTSPRMLLVEAIESDLKSLIEKMRDWIIVPEIMSKLPDPRPRIGKH